MQKESNKLNSDGHDLKRNLPDSCFVLFDVGANTGQNSIEMTRKNSSYFCFAFEPNSSLCAYLKNDTQDIKDRYFIYDFAVANFSGKSTFYVSHHADSGVSSLRPFSENICLTWSGRTDLYYDEEVTVRVITLKEFIETIRPFQIEKLDYLHVDAQGSDLDVLRGLEEHISKVRRGVIEAPHNSHVQLYQGQHNRNEAITFLTENGFAIKSEHWNDPHQNESNLYYSRIVDA